MHLTRSDVDDLRLSADKAKMEGRFEAGKRLHELLDALAAQEDEASRESELDDQNAEYQRQLSDILKEADSVALWSRPGVDDMSAGELREEVQKLRQTLKDIHNLVDL